MSAIYGFTAHKKSIIHYFPVGDEFSETDVKVSVSEDMLVKSRKVVEIKGNL